jgi:uncharacterized membrane protein YqiK
MYLRSAPRGLTIFATFAAFSPEGDGAPPTPPPPPPVKEPETFSREYVQELREENKGTRLKATEAQRKAADADARAKKAEEDAAAKIALAETEAKEKLSKAEKSANDRIIHSELRVFAIKAGMVDLDGLKLADVSKITLEDDGTVKGAEELMAALKEAKPYLFGKPPTGSSNPAPPPPPGDGQPKKAKDMSEDERKAFLKDHKKKFG